MQLGQWSHMISAIVADEPTPKAGRLLGNGLETYSAMERQRSNPPDKLAAHRPLEMVQHVSHQHDVELGACVEFRGAHATEGAIGAMMVRLRICDIAGAVVYS